MFGEQPEAEDLPHIEADLTKGIQAASILESLLWTSIGKQGMVLVQVCSHRTLRNGAKDVSLGPATVWGFRFVDKWKNNEKEWCKCKL